MRAPPPLGLTARFSDQRRLESRNREIDALRTMNSSLRDDRKHCQRYHVSVWFLAAYASTLWALGFILGMVLR